MTDLLDLRGRIGFVTGGTRGIGHATATLLAAHGATVVLASKSGPESAKDVAASIAELTGQRTLGLVCDSTQPAQIRDAYKTIRSEFGQLDFLVNNAGVLDDALIGMISDDLIDHVMSVNGMGPIHHLQAAVRLMRKNGGSIVNMTSIIGINGNVGQAVYAASKAAVIGLTKSAAKELAPKGIRVNAIAPGFIATDMTAALPPDKFQERLDSIKMGRIGTPDDVARAVLFCVSDMSRYVTGQVIGVDGGMLI